MWITPDGPRVLSNKEKDLFIAAAGTGIKMFAEFAVDGSYKPFLDGSRWDALHWHQQVCAISEVAKHLLEGDTVELKPTDWTDQTIAAVYDFAIYTNPLDFEPEAIEAAKEMGMQIKSPRDEEQLAKIIKQMRDKIIGKKTTKKQKIEMFGESYYTEPFPAFSIDRFTKAYELIGEDPEFAMECLPKVIKNRHAAGFENSDAKDYKPWYPIYANKEIRICWK